MNTAILAAVSAVAPHLIKLAEKIYEDKPKSGEDKKNAVVTPLHVLTKLLNASGAPDKDEISGLVEGIFQQMKNSGSISEDVPAAKTQTIEVTSTGTLTIRMI